MRRYLKKKVILPLVVLSAAIGTAWAQTVGLTLQQPTISQGQTYLGGSFFSGTITLSSLLQIGANELFGPDIAPAADYPTKGVHPEFSLDGGTTWQRADYAPSIPVQAGNEPGVNHHPHMAFFRNITPANQNPMVMVWANDSRGVLMQKIAPDGQPLGGAITVATETRTYKPKVAVLSGGEVVAVWRTVVNGNFDIYARRYSAGLAPLTPEFQVNALSANDQKNPDIAPLTDGGFVVVWHGNDADINDYDIYARRYDAQGNPYSTYEYKANTSTTGHQKNPSVAPLSGGGFVVAWHSYGAGTAPAVYVRRLEGANPDQNNIVLSPLDGHSHLNPKVAELSSGRMVTVWQTDIKDGSGWGIYGNLLEAGGATWGLFQLNSATLGDQLNPSLAALPGDRFVAGWRDEKQTKALAVEMVIDTTTDLSIPSTGFRKIGIDKNLLPASAVTRTPVLASGPDGSVLMSFE